MGNVKNAIQKWQKELGFIQSKCWKKIRKPNKMVYLIMEFVAHFEISPMAQIYELCSQFLFLVLNRYINF